MTRAGLALAALLALAGCRGEAPRKMGALGSGAGSLGGSGVPCVAVGSRGGGADDGAALTNASTAATNAGRCLQLASTSYTLLTPFTPANGSNTFLGGATFTCTIPVGWGGSQGQSDACVLVQPTIGSTLTVAANPTLGATSITLTTTTGLSVGGFLQLGQTDAAQTFAIRSITGASNPFTIGLDREIQFPYTLTNGLAAWPSAPPQRVQIHGQGAVFNVTQAGRIFEMSGCRECLVEDVIGVAENTFNDAGAAGWRNAAFSYDVTSFGSVLRRASFDCNGLGGGWGLFVENNEQCRYEDVKVARCLWGAWAYSSTSTTLEDVRVWGSSSDGILLDYNGNGNWPTLPWMPGRANVCRNCVSESNAGAGFHITDGGQDWLISGGIARFNANNGILVDTTGTTTYPPTGTQIVGVKAYSNTGNGVSLASGFGSQVQGGEFVANTGCGVSIASGAKGSQVSGARTRENLANGGFCVGDEATLSSVTSEDDAAAGILLNNSANVTIDGAELTSRLRGGSTWIGVSGANSAVGRLTHVVSRSVAATTWTGSHAYLLKDQAINSGSVYQCITPGTSASSGGPTTTAAQINDGTAQWKYVGALDAPLRYHVQAGGSSKLFLGGLQCIGGGTFGTDQTSVYCVHNSTGGVYATVPVSSNAPFIDVGAADASGTVIGPTTGTVTCNGATPVDVAYAPIASTSTVLLSRKTAGGTPCTVGPTYTISASTKFSVTCVTASCNDVLAYTVFP